MFAAGEGKIRPALFFLSAAALLGSGCSILHKMLFYVITKAVQLPNYPSKVPANLQVLKKNCLAHLRKTRNEKALSSK